MRHSCAMLLLLLAGGQVGAADRLFADGFEALAPPASSIACLAGAAQSASLGALPAGTRSLLTCFELRSDVEFARNEIAYGSVPVPRSVNLRDADLARLVVAGPGDVRLPAQFRAVSRWGASLAADAPIRWLQISVPANVAANGSATFALLRYDSAPAIAVDANAVVVSEAEGRWQIDTGLARFTLDPANPTLFERIDLRETIGSALINALQYQAGAAGFGPNLRVGNGSGALAFEAGNAQAGSLRITSAQLRERGPVQAVVTMDGVFSSGDARSLCTAITPAYEGWQWSLEARFYRGSRQVDLYFLLRNACSTGFGPPWIDQAGQVLSFSWGFPLQATAPNSATQFHAGSPAIERSVGTSAQALRVEQRRGAGTPWQRRARVHRPDSDTTLASALSFARPLAGLRNDRVLAAVSMPWLRFREPQALTVSGDRLQFDAISEPIIVGEGKGLWFVGRLDLAPAGADEQASTRLQQWREAAFAALERGLIPRAASWNNAGEHWPPIDPNGTSAMLGPYLNYMNAHHGRQVSEAPCVDAATFNGSSWDCAKTYGAQLWPDIQFDEQFNFFNAATPADSDPHSNYWNPSGAELWEFLRSGDPKWVWDFALPQTWLQVQTVGLNLGERSDSNRNGFGINGSGSGDGHWHRGEFNSDDYNYNRGQHLAYALRPNYPMLERFAAQGRTVIVRYSVPRTQQAQRQEFIERIDLNRGPMQHFEGLANCAEFVSGAQGTACQSKLAEIVDELVQDNLAAGVVCSADDASQPCFFGQQFMINSMFYTFLLRLQLNYGDSLLATERAGQLRRALIEMPKRYRDFGIALSNGAIDVGGTWAESLNCTRSGDGRSVTACTPVFVESGSLFNENRPQTIALLLMSDWLQRDPTVCQQARAALQAMFPDPNGVGFWQGYANGGWWKGSSQAMQSVIFGLGLETRCSTP